MEFATSDVETLLTVPSLANNAAMDFAISSVAPTIPNAYKDSSAIPTLTFAFWDAVVMMTALSFLEPTVSTESAK
jgi:hypothetical protein